MSDKNTVNQDSTELQKALNGQDYVARDPEVMAYGRHVGELCLRYNTSLDDSEREAIKRELFGIEDARYVMLERGFNCSFGKNVHFKGMAILNYNCTLLDSRIITIGDRTLIGPGTVITCTNHAIDPHERIEGGLFDNKPVTIGDYVWIGANVTILPGVTIGDNAIIGAGSVVTKDIPANVIAVGNPCRVLREVTEADRLASR